MSVIIAVDGPSGSGKSSVAKILANDLNLSYLDTGGMYRVVTYFMLQQNVDLQNEQQIVSMLPKLNLGFKDGFYLLDGLKLVEEIRSPKINQNVSLIAKVREVREYCVKLQRELSQSHNTILDGRDIGTVVFPNASLKFYLDASAETRAKRRFQENLSSVNEQSYEDVLTDIIKRDDIDKNRDESPLIQADDAIYVDTSNMKIEEVVDLLKEKIEELL